VVSLPRAISRRPEAGPGTGRVRPRRGVGRAHARARGRLRPPRWRRRVDRARGRKPRGRRHGHRWRSPDPDRPGRSEHAAPRAGCNMAPWSCWSEWATGTNGMGTALEAPGPVLISGPEHWCDGFDEWVCAAVAVRDPVTADPVAVLDVSTWRHDLPAQAAGWLSNAVSGARAPAPARPRQRRRAGRRVRPGERAVRSGDRRAGRGRQGRHRRRRGEPPPRRPHPRARARPHGALGPRARPRETEPSRHQAGSSRSRLGRLDTDRDRARRRAPAAHAASGIPRQPAHRGACRVRIRERGSRRERGARAHNEPVAAHRGRQRRAPGPAAPARGALRRGRRQRRLARHRRVASRLRSAASTSSRTSSREAISCASTGAFSST